MVTIRHALAVWLASVLGFSSATDVRADSEFKAVSNEKGELRYVVYLKERVARDEDGSTEAPALAPSVAAGRSDIDFRAWHRPSVRALVNRLEKAHGITAVSMTSWAMPAFAVFLSEEKLKALLSDPDVDAVRLSYRVAGYSAWGPWADRPDQGEKVSWGKIASGTDDNLSLRSRVYIIDGHAEQHLTSTLSMGPAPYGPASLSTACMCLASLQPRRTLKARVESIPASARFPLAEEI